MPISPSPGRAVSTVGIDKTAGWGSKDAAGGVIPGHEADQGINHLQGLSEFGIDTGSAPYAYPVAQTGMTGTTVVVNWGTIPACPAGSVKFRLAGSSGAYTTVAEAAGTRTAHTVPITGLTAAKTYEALITQPSWIVGGVPVEFSMRFHTTGGAALEAPEGQQGFMSSGLDGAGAEGTAPPSLSPTPSAEESGAASGLGISGVQAQALDADTVQVTWRTDAYADGQVDWEGGGQSGTATENGNKRMNHLVVLDGLPGGTDFALTITSQDAAGDEASADVEVTTPADA